MIIIVGVVLLVAVVVILAVVHERDQNPPKK